MDYNEENLNWCIHYVSEKDNGIYKLSVIRNETLKLESYHLVVEGKGLIQFYELLSQKIALSLSLPLYIFNIYFLTYLKSQYVCVWYYM